MTSPPTYTHDQITKYFDRLELPDGQRKYSVADLNDHEALEYLALLQKLHLAAIPFENLSLHYSTHRSVSVHPDDLFRKIIGDDNGRGGYCMENNRLFGTLLSSLAFTLYSGGGRVYLGNGAWTGWSHMVNLVTIGDTKYHVDVGFGADGPIVPMPLHRSGTTQQHIKPASTRLQWRNIDGNLDPNQRLWVLEYRRSDESDWEINYVYTELEFQPQDYTIMNYFCSTSQRIWFTQSIAVEKKILGDHGELVGKLTLVGNSLKRNIHGEKKEHVEFKSEAERLDALEKYFGIKFGEAERDAIQGLPSEIK
jgi:arylamine N-acetyltransferase